MLSFDWKLTPVSCQQMLLDCVRFADTAVILSYIGLCRVRGGKKTSGSKFEQEVQHEW